MHLRVAIDHLSGLGRTVGHIARVEECGTRGIIECSAYSGGEWVGILRYGFSTNRAGGPNSNLKAGDTVSFVTGRSDDGCSWATEVALMKGMPSGARVWKVRESGASLRQEIENEETTINPVRPIEDGRSAGGLFTVQFCVAFARDQRVVFSPDQDCVVL